jgi:Mlc titration factor MtfA (ptsG expression regulator)
MLWGLVLYAETYQAALMSGLVMAFLAGGAVAFWVINRSEDTAPPVPIHPAIKQLLRQYSTYYQRLPAHRQIEFARRVQQFVLMKRFVPRNMDRVTTEMKVLIAASAVQLTFGLSRVFLKHFKTILIYPDSYYSTINKMYHKGEVNPAYGIIVLSWSGFVEGIANAEDSLNLGLHEMAHALRLENVINNGEHNFLDEAILERWEEESIKERQKMREGHSHFFRNYAKVDREEFFAIAVENFFERPQRFWEELPHLYRTLSLLLNQDPLVVSR